MQLTQNTTYQKIIDNMQDPGAFSSGMLELFLLANTVEEITDNESKSIYDQFSLLHSVIDFSNTMDEYRTILDKGPVLNSKGELDTDYVFYPHPLPSGPEFENLITDFFIVFPAKQILESLFMIYSEALGNDKVLTWDADKRIQMSLCVWFAIQSFLDLEACSKSSISLS